MAINPKPTSPPIRPKPPVKPKPKATASASSKQNAMLKKSGYTRASGTVLTRSQELKNRTQVNKERLQTLKEDKAVKRKAITAANNKMLQNAKDRRANKMVKRGK